MRRNSLLQHQKTAGSEIEMQKLIKRIELLLDRAELVLSIAKAIKRSGGRGVGGGGCDRGQCSPATDWDKVDERNLLRANTCTICAKHSENGYRSNVGFVFPMRDKSTKKER